MQSVRFWTMAMVASLLSVIPTFAMQWCSCDCSFTLGTRPQQVVQQIQVPQASAAVATAPEPEQMEESPRTQSYNEVQPAAPLTVLITPPGAEDQDDPPTVVISTPTDLPGTVPQA